MKTKARMVIMSHLSDAQEGIKLGYANNSTVHNINFIKYLVLNCEDLNEEIDADEMYQKFVESMK